jgi:ornithine cyclodeaminase
VGAFKPDHREIDDEVIRRGRVYVDSRLAAVEESGDLVIPLASGLMTHADIHGDLFELCRGSVSGRTDPDQITVFENGGGGHLDLMSASHLWSRFRGG